VHPGNRRLPILVLVVALVGGPVLAAGLARSAVAPASAEPTWRERIREKLRGVGESRRDRPELHPEQLRSLEFVYYRARDPEQGAALGVALPAEDEVAAFVANRPRMNEESLAMLDDFYGTDERLKSLSVRDSDGDGLADYRISDYFGKFSEGDVDVDGDGVRNVFDSHPYDAASGGRDQNGDGAPDSGFTDRNGNGLPDHLDWAITGREPELVALQAGLLRDFNIMLVERDAAFDLPLARAVDDAIRRLFGHPLAGSRGLPTLRTVAVEHTALLTEQLAAEVGDDTSAQVLYNSQSLVVYDRGRDVRDPIALLGLLAHEIGHAWHMSLDWDARHPERENARNEFPAPQFVKTVEPFGWTVDGYFDGALDDELPVRPQFLYSGISEPEFLYRDRTPQDWAEWLNEVYAELGEPEDYLEHEQFASRGIVGDYSLTSPYEWFCDNLQAYLLVTLEETALAGLGPEAAERARERITASLRAVWPGYNHRNIGPDVREYFAQTFPITPADRELLAQRYLAPVIAGGTPAGD
jgi:hypothetical protein